jgi:hypothetical protein
VAQPNTTVPSILQAIQIDAANRLLSDPYFANISVLTENLQDITFQIEKAIQELGIVAIILTPTADIRNFADAPGPYLQSIDVLVEVAENVLLNRGQGGSGKTAQAMAERVLAILHGYRPAMITESIYASSPTITVVPSGDGLLIYHIRFRTNGGINYSVPTVSTPVVSTDGANVTITCDTSGAAIFYTINGTAPGPRTGTLYAGPISPPTPRAIKAQAWLAGYQTSGLATFTFTGAVVPFVPDTTVFRLVNGVLSFANVDGNRYALGVTNTSGPTLMLSQTIVQGGARVHGGVLELLCPDDGLWYAVTAITVDGEMDFALTLSTHQVAAAYYPGNAEALNVFAGNTRYVGGELEIFGDDNDWWIVAIVSVDGEPALELI